MKIKTKCDHCGKIYQMEDSNLGRTAQCRNCQNHFTMALFEEPAAPPPVQPPAYGQAPPVQPPAAAPPVQPPAYGQGVPGQYPPAAAPPAYGQAPPVQPPAAPPPPAYGQGAPVQSNVRTVICPKCQFTADIPQPSRKLKLRCQECGHRFIVKPEPRNRPGRPMPTEKAEKGGSSKAGLALLLIIVLAAGVLFAGPALFPDLFSDLGLPNLLELLS